LPATRNPLGKSEDDSGDEGRRVLALRRNEEFAMRTRHRVCLQLTLLLFVVYGPIVSDAGAASVAVAFAGTVNPMLPNVPFPATVRAGNPIINTSFFSYNTSSFSGSSTTGMYTLNGLNPLAQGFTLNINTSPLSPTKWSDGYLGSPAAFTIKVTGSTHPGATLDIHLSTFGGNGVIKPGAFVDLFLTSSTYVGQALPTSANIGQFFNNAATLTWDPPGGSSAPSEGFEAAIFDFRVVPEPSSLILALAAMGTGTAGFLVRRRKAGAGLADRL
jgi:PEP-CTERM motif